MTLKRVYKPVLIVIPVEEFIKTVKVKAYSQGGCYIDGAGENACGEWADGNDGTSGGSWGHMCIEIGPLFGCDEHEDFYCSTIITPIFR